MSLVHTKFFLGFRTLFEYADPRIENYFLMGSPLHIMTIVTLYVIFVFKTGPALMKNREPLKLEKVIMMYNWLQIILNGTLFLVALRELPKLSLFCSPMDKSNTRDAITMMDLQYFYTMLKVLDLLDTIFFVLRKKQTQVTFLHVYHHLMMVIFTWIASKFFVGGQVYFLGLPNLFVHVVMYFYYFLTAWNPVYKQNIWWKKHITQLQICQHCFIFTAFALPLLNPTCSYPKGLLCIFLVQTILMIYLFVDFYVRTYVRTSKKVK